jgi:hypothetical protein
VSTTVAKVRKEWFKIWCAYGVERATKPP